MPATTTCPSPSDSDSMPAPTTCPSPSETMSSATISQTPSSSASASPPTPWDVFLSFHGKDTRNNFTSHLYDKLVCNGLRTFMDDPELRKGEVISDSLIQAIHESKTYIVVFSKNYASSHWCLDELVKILNCHKTAERLVIPVFYKIDPSVVRHQVERFKGAFEKHHDRFEIEKVEEWRSTLKQVADLSGFPICENRPEADVINQIVDEILPKINSKVLHVTKYPVGLDSRVQELTALLNSGTEKDFTKIGFYGMGGVGKTTLAKALFNQLLRTGSFKGSCFLANVREVSGTFKGLESLQQKFINSVLNSKKEIVIDNVEEGIKLIKERIFSEKVLVLIDDIDDPRQYESLVGSFASGSLVITTTRDQDILDKIEVEPKFQYRVNELDDAQSLELFTQHAFRNAEPNNTLMLLSADILRHADGLPLALEVFGSYLYNQSEVGWKSYIEKLKRFPNTNIQQKLIISLNAVESDDPMLKKIFLDIACFFIGWDKGRVVKIMDTYYSFADHNIDILEKRCLLKVNYYAHLRKHELGMHDLLRDMGREIVRNISPDDPGRQSRLWVPEDVYDVLKKHKGTEAIEGIMPRTSGTFRTLKQFRPETFSTETFKRMIKLRFLCLDNVNLTGNFKQTFEDLRWFRWKHCPLKCLPSDFYPQKLGILELPYSKMRTIWENNLVPHVFEKIKILNMMKSKDLTKTPDFTALPFLESLNLAECKSLKEVHISIGSLARLRYLNLSGCVMLRSLPDTICDLRSLEILYVKGCITLEAATGNIESLKEIFVSELPVSKEIFVSELPVSKLPGSIGSLLNYLILCLHDKKMLETLETLPDTICNLRSLELLYISNCKKLEIIADELRELTRLRQLNAFGARMLKKFQPSQIALSLQSLTLAHTGITALPSGISQLSNLQYLEVSYLYLLSIPKLPPNLKAIWADSCSSLERLPDLSNLKQLEKLKLYGCSNLTDIQGLEELTALSELDFINCTGLTYIQGFEALISIRILQLDFTRTDDLGEYNLTKRLCQMYSEFGREIIVCGKTQERCFESGVYGRTLNGVNQLDWITESPFWTGQSSELYSATLYAHLLPNEWHNFMGLILFVEPVHGYTFGYSVKNTTSGFIWSHTINTISSGHLLGPVICFYRCQLMVIVPKSILPKSIFSVSDDDHIIEFTVDECVKIIGIHLLYKTGTETIEDAVTKHETSFDALKLVDPELQDIFLDIACFFIGWKVKKVVQILKTYYANVDRNIDVLKKRCLLMINDCDKLEMDNLLRHIGRKIARNNSPDEPGKHNRLWLSIDIYDVLKKHQGTEAIQGIIPRKLDFSRRDVLKEESFTVETFKRMSKLRFLYLNEVNFTGSFEQAFKELRWFCWNFCPLKCLPLDFYPEELVALELPNSSMRAIWEPNMVSRVFGKLKNLNMSNSQDLVTTPDFIKLPCLETLNLKGCKSLEEVHLSIGSLVRLDSLYLEGCERLTSLPDSICSLRALKVLTISWCSSLEALPIQLGNIESLTKLDAGGLTVSEIPDSIGRLTKLVELDLSRNKKLETLPDTICNLRSLEILNISCCISLDALPMAFGDIEALKELILGGLAVSKLPDSIGRLSKLVKLDLSHNRKLETLPDTICNLRSLEVLNLDSCSSLEAMPMAIGNTESLK